MLKIKPKRTKPYTPRTNGKAERFVQTCLREWAKPAQGSGRRSLLEWPAEGYANHYKHHRPHCGINGCPPISRIPTNNLSRHDI
jgi:transposase InsO family protein